MKLVFINSAKPIVATVQANEFDSEPLLLPLTPDAQKAFSRRARNNRLAGIVTEMMAGLN